MKKTLITLFITVQFLTPAIALASNGQVFVYNYEGHAGIVRNSKTILVAFDFPLLEKDIIRVEDEPDYFVDVIINYGVGARILANSVCQFVNTNPNSAVLNLSQGSALFNLKKLPNNATFSVETPTAIAEVRGTQFLVKITKMSQGISTTFSVKKGTVNVKVKSSSSTVVLLENQYLDVSHQGFIPPTRSTSDEEREAMRWLSAIYIASEE